MTAPLILPGAFSLPTPSIPRNTASSVLQSPSAGRLSTLFRQRRVRVVPQSLQGFRGSGLRRRLHRHVHRPVLWAVFFLNRTRGVLALNQLCCSSSAALRSGDAGRWQLELVDPFAVVGPLLDGLRAANYPLSSDFDFAVQLSASSVCSAWRRVCSRLQAHLGQGWRAHASSRYRDDAATVRRSMGVIWRLGSVLVVADVVVRTNCRRK
jgi:hypothetical protein